MLHRVVKVTRGTRFACVGWIESYVRSIEDRSILFGRMLVPGLWRVMAAQDELDLIFQSYTNAIRRLSDRDVINDRSLGTFFSFVEGIKGIKWSLW